jgi:hypothetical protein
MGRSKTQVSKTELQDAINKVESEQTFDKIGDLFKAIAETDWAKNLEPRPLTNQVAYLRFKDYGLECKTKKARRSGNERKVEQEEKVVSDESTLRNHKLAEALGSPKTVTRIPSGECPVKLRGTDQVSVWEWIEKIQDHYHELDTFIAPEGLAYFVNYNFHSSWDGDDRRTNKYNEVCSHIKDWVDEMTQDSITEEDLASF